MTSTPFELAAKCRGVNINLSTAVGEVPLLINNRTTSTLFVAAALCRGVEKNPGTSAFKRRKKIRIGEKCRPSCHTFTTAFSGAGQLVILICGVIVIF